MRNDNPLSPAAIAAGLIVTILGGIIVAIITGEGRFSGVLPTIGTAQTNLSTPTTLVLATPVPGTPSLSTYPIPSSTPLSNQVIVLSPSTEVSYLNNNTAQWKGNLNTGIDESLLIAKQVLQRFSGSEPIVSEKTSTRKVVNANVGLSWQSFGELVEIIIETENDDPSKVQKGFLTQITVTSRSKVGFTMFDWGKIETM